MLRSAERVMETFEKLCVGTAAFSFAALMGSLALLAML
jgi:hypothetical protein